MSKNAHFTHILDDQSLGGVTRALDNFSHPDIKAVGVQHIFDLHSRGWKTLPDAGTAIIHFTASWKKLGELHALKRSRKFSNLILIEHSYTEGFENNCVTHGSRFRLMLSLAYRLVDRVVAVSNSQRNWMLEAGLAPANKIVSIPQARDCVHLFDLPIARRQPGPLRLGAYGRFHEQKGFDLLIEAMSDISHLHCSLRIAGYGDELDRLKAMAAPLPHVSIEPAFSCPRSFLSEVDIVAIPSRWEAFGLVGAEARAAGRPIIAADIDGLKDQVGLHSWSHRPNDILDIRHTILSACRTTDLFERSQLARAHVASEYRSMIGAWANLQKEFAQA